MTPSPAFQLYVNDFLGSAKVGMMSADEVGTYVLLLCLDWQEGGFVYDAKRLAKWCRLSPSAFKRAWVQVGQCFVERDGRQWNPRLEREREKQAEWREKSKKGGTKAQENKRHPSNGGSDSPPTVVQPPYGEKTDTLLLLPSSTPVTTSPSSPATVVFVAREDLLRRLPESRRPAWEAELNATEQGMHGPLLSPEQIELACRDFLANGGLDSPNPSLKLLRGYMRNHESPPVTPHATVKGANPFDTPEMRVWAAAEDAKDKTHA